MYLKDLSPYLRQFLPYSNSQNTIRVNLLGNPTPLVVNTLLTILYLHTQPISAPTVVLLLGVVTASLLGNYVTSFPLSKFPATALTTFSIILTLSPH